MSRRGREFKNSARYSKAYIRLRDFNIATKKKFYKRVTDISNPYGRANEG
jgi:hypothetical protein